MNDIPTKSERGEEAQGCDPHTTQTRGNNGQNTHSKDAWSRLCSRGLYKSHLLTHSPHYLKTSSEEL